MLWDSICVTTWKAKPPKTLDLGQVWFIHMGLELENYAVRRHSENVRDNSNLREEKIRNTMEVF